MVSLRDALLHTFVKNGEVNQDLTLRQSKATIGYMMASEKLATACLAVFEKMSKHVETDYGNLSWNTEKKLLREAIEEATGKKIPKATVANAMTAKKKAEETKEPSTKELIEGFEKAVKPA